MTYHIEAFNPGDMPARDVMLSEDTPDGFHHVSTIRPPKWSENGPSGDWGISAPDSGRRSN